MPNKLSIVRKNKQSEARTQDNNAEVLEARLLRAKSRLELTNKKDRTIHTEDLQKLYIYDKGKVLRPFEFWGHQYPILEYVNGQICKNEMTRLIDLKPRQCGHSTVFALITYFLCTRYGLGATIIGHKDTASRNLASMVETAYMNDSYFDRGEIKADRWNDNEIRFPGGGRILVATAGSKAALTSTTNQIVLATEVAYWPGDVPQQLKSLLNTVSDTHPFTFIFLESTAVPGTIYQDRWNDAMAKMSSYFALFTSWLQVKEYMQPFPTPESRSLFTTTYNADEDYLSDQGASPEQLLWRRGIIADKCEGTTYESKKLSFMSEYPLTPDEAFASSEAAIFEATHLNTLKAQSVHNPPIFIGDCAYYGVNATYTELIDNEAERNKVFLANPFGKVRVWEWVQSGVQYVIGSDVSLGIVVSDNKTDDSTIVVRRQDTGKVVLVWRGKIPPDDFADYLTFVGLFYNTAYICCENNNMGQATVLKLWKQYPRYALFKTKYGVDEKEHERVGYYTLESTKSRLITVLHTAIRHNHFECYDKEILDELLSIIRDGSGKIELNGKDLAVACMLSEIARCDNVEYSTPIPPKEIDDYQQWKAWKRDLERQANMAYDSDISGIVR